MTDPAEPHEQPPVRLVLASASPRRHRLLAELGLEFDILAADIDEHRRLDEPPAAYAERLAIEKAEAVLMRLTDVDGDGGSGRQARRYRVLGADTVVVAPDGDVLGKPADADEARQMLHSLSDASHTVFTGVAVAESGRPTRYRVERTVVTFTQLDDAHIDEYIATGEPFDAAGAYAIQGEAGRFVNRIEGSFDNVVGLPMHQVADLLRRH